MAVFHAVGCDTLSPEAVCGAKLQSEWPLASTRRKADLSLELGFVSVRNDLSVGAANKSRQAFMR